MKSKTIADDLQFWIWFGIIVLIIVLLLEGCASPGASVMTKCPDDGGIVWMEGYAFIYKDSTAKYVVAQYRCNFCFRVFWVTNDYPITNYANSKNR